MMVLKKKSVNLKFDKSIKTFNRLIKQCYGTVSSIKKVKSPKVVTKKLGRLMFYQNMQCVIVKYAVCDSTKS